MNQSSSGHISFGGPITPIVKFILLACGGMFLVQHLVGETIYAWLGLTPFKVCKEFYLWQAVSYIFLHAGILHLVFNLFTLYIFGSTLEQLWGSWFFCKYFFITGIGAGISMILVTPSLTAPTVGASGAIFGILLAYALYFPNRVVYFLFIFPIKTKYLILIYGLVTFYVSFWQTESNIAHLAHLGGMLFGLVYLNFYVFKNILIKQIRNVKAARIRKRYRIIEGGEKAQGQN